MWYNVSMEEDKQELTSDNKPLRNEKGQLLPGSTANPNGRPPETEADKILYRIHSVINNRIVNRYPFGRR